MHYGKTISFIGIPPKSCICHREAMRCTCGNNHQLGKVLTKKPLMAKDDELKENVRSRSAKMRVFKTDLS